MLKLYASKKQEAGVAWNTDFHTNPTEITESNQYDFFRYDHTAILFKDGKRVGENFVHATAIVIDIDNKEIDAHERWATPASVSEKLEMLGIAHAIATSRNHQLQKENESPRPRFHVYFPLSEPCDLELYKKMTDYAIETFDGDSATKGTSRHFFGYGSNQHALVYQRTGKYTFDEYSIAHSIASRRAETKTTPVQASPPQTDGKRPGDALNEDGVGFIKDILQKHGWTYVGHKSEHDELWRRPGKNAGHSAILHTDTPTFYVFSSDAAPLDVRTYTYFTAYATLEHGGDFSAAAKELATLGYGDALTATPVDLSGFMTTPPNLTQETNVAEAIPMQMPSPFDDFAVENLDEIKNDDMEDPGLIPEDLLHPPGLVGEIAKYCFDTNPVQQQEFALATGITMVAHLIGQNYQTPDACRSNFYALSVGKSGTGKNRAITFFRSRQIKEVARSIVGTFSGHAALLRYLQKKTKTLLMVWDEVGGKLEEIIKKPNSPTSQLLDYLTELYSSAESSVSADIKVSDIEAPDVTEPHCSLYGTGTFKSVFKAMTPDLIERGFIGRVSFFFADPDKKKRKMHARAPVPENIVEQIKAWAQKPLALPPPQTQCPSLFQMFPEPIVVAYTEEAKQIFDYFSDHCTNAEENTPEDFQCLWVRSVEEAKKLALIYACSVSMEEPVIDAEAATWACRLSEHLTLRKLYIANHHMAVNEQGHLENDILNYVKKKKNQTATQSEITHRFKKGVDPALRKKAIHNLLITAQLTREKRIVGESRQHSTVYRVPYKSKTAKNVRE